MAVPEVDRSRCVACGRCASFCPQERDVLARAAFAASHAADPRLAGVEGASAFLAWDQRDDARRRSASGGVATGVALKLLADGMIDGVVHVGRLSTGRGGPHYRAMLSVTPEEVESGRGSAYETIDFSEVLMGLKSKRRYFVTGTPCVIRGIRRLVAKHPRYADVNVYTCALVCSHNATSLLADYLADRHRIPESSRYAVDFRDKDGIPDAGEYNTRYFDAGGDLLKMNRNVSGWTEAWRAYAFAPRACSYCSDFWGSDADMSVKDAWGRKEWVSDPLGKSVAIFRNKALEKVFLSCGFATSGLSEEDLAGMQEPQTRFKLAEAEAKFEKPRFSLDNIRNGLFTRLTTAAMTRFAYRCFGDRGVRVALRLLAKLPLPKRGRKDVRRKGLKMRMILVAGGYGNGNAGDEAQCAETLRLLKERYPRYQIRNLTPRPDYSADGHPGFAHDYAPRVMFFNNGRAHDWYKLTGRVRKVGFLLTGLWLLFNARLVRRNWPVVFLNARKAMMLQQLSQAALFFFCGGGYLTGATRSRLWEGAFICRLCHIFGVPVAMSGHTIGEWHGRFDRLIARWGFRHVRVITVRDNESSLADLAKVGVSGPHVFPTHDDALFCAVSSARQAVPARYVAVNFHFWGMNRSESGKILERLHRLLPVVRERLEGLPLVFIPMHEKDMRSFRAYVERYPDDGLLAFEYDYDFRKVRRVIADAELLLTMKHHPIIFAVGENTPVVSLAYSAYYVHKNLGALQQYGVEACSIDLASDGWASSFDAALDRALDRNWFVKTVNEGKEAARKRKDRFLRYVDRILESTK